MFLGPTCASPHCAPRSGPGIELLEYLSPRDGRPFPLDEHANDLVHRQTELETDDAESAVAALRPPRPGSFPLVRCRSSRANLASIAPSWSAIQTATLLP